MYIARSAPKAGTAFRQSLWTHCSGVAFRLGIGCRVQAFRLPSPQARCVQGGRAAFERGVWARRFRQCVQARPLGLQASIRPSVHPSVDPSIHLPVGGYPAEERAAVTTSTASAGHMERQARRKAGATRWVCDGRG